MIKRLRNRFIRIATLSVAAVMLLLTVILNVANYSSIDRDQQQTLNLIYENQGTIPGMQTPPDSTSTSGAETAPAQKPDKKQDRSGSGPFTAETPFSTRFFVLRYQDDGTLVQSDFGKIASVTEEDTQTYLDIALAHGEGYGYTGTYRFLVAHTGDDKNMVIFLDCYQGMRSIKTVLVWSLVADAACILLVFLLVVLLSRKAIDPVVRSAQQQKQFITDASHELKTPLTVITTSLKVLEMEVGQQKWIDKAQAQAQKMSGLINRLVTLSRLDEEHPPIAPADFDLAQATMETAESFRSSAEDAGLSLRLDIPPQLVYLGDEAALRQLVSILMDNALKYASSGGTISLALKKTRSGAVLTCANPCEPMDPAELPRFFDRFYRPDKSRTSATGGFGVGLSIARSIAEVHGGSIRAEFAPDGCIVFTAELK